MARRITRSAVLLAAAAASGAAAGVASFVFLESLERVTAARLDHPWLVWLLPVAGLVIGLGSHRMAPRIVGGTSVVVGQARRYTDGVSGWTAPVVLAGTLLGHLVGASVGREGTAVQMSSSLTDAGARRLRLSHDDRAILARAALAGGFGSVFGVPAAGVIFAIEASRRRSVAVLATAVTASFVGDAVVGLFGHEHAMRSEISVPLGLTTPLRLIAAGLILGLLARLVTVSFTTVRKVSTRLVRPAALRPAFGGLATLCLLLLVGRDHLGLSLPLIDAALSPLSPDGLNGWDPLLKVAFTAIALGSGFVGGEVTPLFVVGATAGAVLAGPLGLPGPALGAIGLAVVFAACAHVPITGIVLAVELFGAGALVPTVLVCAAARAVAHPRGLYDDTAGERRQRRRFTLGRVFAPEARVDHGSDRRST